MIHRETAVPVCDLRRVLRRFVLRLELLVPVVGSIMPRPRPRYALHATLKLKLRSLEGSRCQWSSVACHSGTVTPSHWQLEVGMHLRLARRVAPGGRRCGPIRAFQFLGAGCQWASFFFGAACQWVQVATALPVAGPPPPARPRGTLADITRARGKGTRSLMRVRVAPTPA